MTFGVVLGALVFAAVLWFAAKHSLLGSARRRSAARQAFLLAASTTELATILRDALRDETWGWHRFEAGKSALSHAGPWTEQELLQALEDLFEDANEEDRKGHRDGGRDSYYFDFYDCGLAAMAEALRTRLGISQPWEKRRPA